MEVHVYVYEIQGDGNNNQIHEQNIDGLELSGSASITMIQGTQIVCGPTYSVTFDAELFK